jgi:hypothetical protein
MLLAPGVRDRVVNIALRNDEGGLNLDMTPDVIADLDRRGRVAGLSSQRDSIRSKPEIQKLVNGKIRRSRTTDGSGTAASWPPLKISPVALRAPVAHPTRPPSPERKRCWKT